MLYETSVNLNFYELNILLNVLEKEINENDTQDLEKEDLKAMYKKFEDHMCNIDFSKDDDIEKILEEQKNLYKNDERG